MERVRKRMESMKEEERLRGLAMGVLFSFLGRFGRWECQVMGI